MVVLASIPVSLYSPPQAAGHGPFVWRGDADVRVTSTLGNAIFAGGYLAMVILITVAGAASALTHVIREPEKSGHYITRGAIFSFACAMQVAALWKTGTPRKRT